MKVNLMQGPDLLLWPQLLELSTLRKAWHLARVDEGHDYIHDNYSLEVFANNLEDNLIEIKNRLETESYEPKVLQRINIPKGNMGIRPGTKMSIEDRIILTAIVILISPQLDSQLDKESICSYRLKNISQNDDFELFQENEIEEKSKLIAKTYIKRGHIFRYVDDFEQWYKLWPEFDRKSKNAFNSGYKYLATSDISAYFENIQIPLLRDQLFEILHDEPKIINLLCYFLEKWAFKTDTGRIHLRGIPQSSSVASFLGNIFLLKLDKNILELKKR